MTLIAGFVTDGFPVLLGDLILSGPSQVDPNFVVGHNEIALPSTGITEVNSCHYEGIRIGSLTSKIALINKNLAFAWSGNLDRASRLLTHIYREADPKIEDINSIDELFKTANYDDLDYTKLIILFRLANGNYCLCHKDADVEFRHEFFGDGFSAGSGARQFKNEIEFFSLDRIRTYSGNPEDVGAVSLGKAIMSAGHLLTRQISTGAFFDQYFGGCFEIAFVGENGIQKLDNISFLFWTIDESWESFALVPLAIHISYIDDVMVIKRCEGFRADGLPVSLDQRNIGIKTFCLRPIYRPLASSSFLSRIDNNMNSTHQCHCFLGKAKDQEVVAYLPHINARQSAVKFEWDQNGLSFWIKQNFQNQLYQFVSDTKEQVDASG